MGTLLNRALGTGAIGNLVENVLGEVAGVVIGHLGASAINSAAATLHKHFTLSGHELGLAFQDSLGRGLAAIALGVAAPTDEGARWWQETRKLLSAKLVREYAQALETSYLRPFVQQRGLGEREIGAFRATLAETCRRLADRRADILPDQSLSEEDFAAMAQGAAREDLSRMLLRRLTEIAPPDPLVADFLAEQGLLGDALLYFLREKLRRDDRVQRTLTALQQQGVWTDVRDTQATLAQLQQAVQQAINERQGQVQQALQQGDYAQLATLTTELRQLAQRQGQLPELLEQAQAAWRANETRLENLSGRFQVWSELAQVRLEQIGELLTGLSAQLDDLGRAMGAGFDRLGDDLGQLKAHLGAQAVAFRAVIQLLERQGLGCPGGGGR